MAVPERSHAQDDTITRQEHAEVIAIVAAERNVAQAEVERLRERIEKAPHAMHCEAGAGFLPGPCNCWKRVDA